MEWTTIIKEAVDYIETHITDNITINDVAGHVCADIHLWNTFVTAGSRSRAMN